MEKDHSTHSTFDEKEKNKIVQDYLDKGYEQVPPSFKLKPKQFQVIENLRNAGGTQRAYWDFNFKD
ncbi:hypothetical protein D0S45_17505 [Marinifilum sp. JC120]|nr:hypothetical protein D0S45_17505 [Marinifilum sp. JC120]